MECQPSFEDVPRRRNAAAVVRSGSARRWDRGEAPGSSALSSLALTRLHGPSVWQRRVGAPRGGARGKGASTSGRRLSFATGVAHDVAPRSTRDGEEEYAKSSGGTRRDAPEQLRWKTKKSTARAPFTHETRHRSACFPRALKGVGFPPLDCRRLFCAGVYRLPRDTAHAGTDGSAR